MVPNSSSGCELGFGHAGELLGTRPGSGDVARAHLVWDTCADDARQQCLRSAARCKLRAGIAMGFGLWSPCSEPWVLSSFVSAFLCLPGDTDFMG